MDTLIWGIFGHPNLRNFWTFIHPKSFFWNFSDTRKIIQNFGHPNYLRIKFIDEKCIISYSCSTILWIIQIISWERKPSAAVTFLFQCWMQFSCILSYLLLFWGGSGLQFPTWCRDFFVIFVKSEIWVKSQARIVWKLLKYVAFEFWNLGISHHCFSYWN